MYFNIVYTVMEMTILYTCKFSDNFEIIFVSKPQYKDQNKVGHCSLVTFLCQWVEMIYSLWLVNIRYSWRQWGVEYFIFFHLKICKWGPVRSSISHQCTRWQTFDLHDNTHPSISPITHPNPQIIHKLWLGLDVPGYIFFEWEVVNFEGL